MSAVLLVVALLLDLWLGEPRRRHPLVGFGHCARWLEQWLRCWQRVPLKLAGALGWLLLVIPLPLLLWGWLQQLPPQQQWLGGLLEALLLYLCIGGRSLAEHARRVGRALASGDLNGGRRAVAMMVSRDTSALNQTGVVKGAVESVLENGSDAQFAPIFWFLVAGAPGALAYRLANTLDAMWGYRNERYRNFGWAAARLDDLLNWLPARLCALAYGLAGEFASALRCWRRQAPAMDSPNGGPVMAAGAGALQIELGGAAVYHKRIKQRPVLGCGRPPQPRDIDRALALFWRSLAIWVGAIVIWQWF